MPRVGGSHSISLSRQGFADFVALSADRGQSRAELVEDMLASAQPMAPRPPVRHHDPEAPRLSAIDRLVLRSLGSWSTVLFLCDQIKRSPVQVQASIAKLVAVGALEEHGDRLVMYRRARRPRRAALVVLRAAGLVPEERV